MKKKEFLHSKSALSKFVVVGTILTLVFLIAYTFNRDLYYEFLQGDRSDTFMDFFNSVSHAMGRDPYGIKAIYPPLCYILYWGLGLAMGNSAMELLEQNETRQLAVRGLSQPMMVYWVYFLVSFVIFLYLVYRLTNGKKYERIWFVALVTVSVPFMFQFERANIIFISLLGTMAFFVWKDSNNKYLREFAMICLALSAALKIYPAIFGLILIKEKRYKETCRLMIYGLVCFFVPFLFIRGGFANIPQFISNLIYTSTIDSAQREGYKLSYSAIISYVVNFLSNNSLLAEEIGSKLSLGITILAVCALPWIQKSWKVVLLLTCLLVGVPNMSYTYTAIFFIVPLICFLNAAERSTFRWMYLLFFLLILFPLPLGWSEHAGVEAYYIYNRSFNTLQISIIIFATTCALIAEGIYFFSKRAIKRVLLIRVLSFAGAGALLVMMVLVGNTNYKKALESKQQLQMTVNKTIKKCKINFNNRDFKGIYTGKTINNIPNGEGEFTFSKNDGNLILKGQWKDGSLNGKAKIIYPSGLYEVALFEHGQAYGNVISYSASGEVLGRDWYYNSQKLSDIQAVAKETEFQGMQNVDAIYPGTIFKCQGEIIKVTQSAEWIEIIVKDSQGGKYLFEYYNSTFTAGNSIKTPNLRKGDRVICYGQLNGKNKKDVLGLNLIGAQLENEDDIDLDEINYSYATSIRYPYQYLGNTVKVEGIVSEIVRDFDNNTLVYKVESNKEFYAIVFGMNSILSPGYKMPDDDKQVVMKKFQKTLPNVGEEIQYEGVYKGNYIWGDKNKETYHVIPYLGITVELGVEKDNYLKKLY